MSRSISLAFAAALLSACGGVNPAPGSVHSAQRAAHGPVYLHEYTLPLGTYPGSIAGGPDGALWFTTYPYFTNHRPINLGVGRITTAGKFEFFKFERGTYDIARGDGNRLWWTNAYHKPYSVGFITTGGVRTEFAASGGGTPESVTTDDAGNAWYTDFGGNPDVVQIDRNGQTMHTYDVNSGYAVKTAWGIGDRLWFDAINTPHSPVGFITDGHVREMPIEGPNYIPGPLAAGPDGRMWVCDGGSMAAVTPLLRITLYPLPANHGCFGVAVGSDGNVWTADFESGSLLRITPAGTVTAFPVPTPQMMPSGITAGPDGNLWYTEIQRNTDVAKIGVLKP